jgi:hypothetical protein
VSSREPRGASPALRALTDELGARPPQGVAVLDDEHLALLAAALRAAHGRQERAMAAAGEAALAQIPAVLRRPLYRLLGGQA